MLNYKMFLFLVLFISSSRVFAQTENLELRTYCKNKTNAKQVHCIDKRADKNTLGFVQTGITNKLKGVVFNGSLMDSISQFFRNNQLVNYDCEAIAILINDIFLSERTGALKEVGNLKLGMRIFISKDNNQFQEIMAVDETYPVQSMDVTQQLLSSVSTRLCLISADLKGKLYQEPLSQERYSLPELNMLDSLEKSKIPIFIADKPNAGLFRTYESFKANQPDSIKLRIDDKGKNYSIVYTYEGKKKNRPKRLYVDDVFAVSDGTNVFVTTEYGYVKTVKENLDYVLVMQEIVQDKGPVVFWGAMFGLAGSVIASEATKHNNKHIRMKINHVNGNLMLAN